MNLASLFVCPFVSYVPNPRTKRSKKPKIDANVFCVKCNLKTSFEVIVDKVT